MDVLTASSAGIEVAWVVSPQRGAGQDRVRVVLTPGGVVVALADGAGGTGGGAQAAQAVVDAVADAATRPEAVRPTWSELLEALDRDPRLGGGQATAVIAELGRDGVVGASVGDSQAWLVAADGAHVLTSAQQRKPLVGAGAGAAAAAFGAGAGAAAAAFGAALAGATLIVASDGLFAYARRTDIARLASGADLAAAARALAELVRLPGGGLPDDVAIVLCRAAR